jgi:hypothetical protein
MQVWGRNILCESIPILLCKRGGGVMDKCECGGELFPIDTEDHDCDCGQTYCGECDAEYSKEGEKLSGGRG